MRLPRRMKKKLKKRQECWEGEQQERYEFLDILYPKAKYSLHSIFKKALLG